jgi:serine/threonine protein kinase
MSFPLDQFVRNLVESQLMTAAEAAAFQQQLPPEHPPQSGEDLAREMVRQNVLTTFQAAALYQGRLKELVFGPYVVLDKLGAGKMGFVYKARHKELGLIFAIKVLPARRLAQSPKALARFQREVALHVRLIHPNIVRVHDAGEAHGLPYLVMEYVEGQDLDSLVKETGPLPPAEAVECIVQAAAGMAYAHREGVVHRDIKPANLLLDKNGVVKVLDLGLGRFDDQALGAEDEGGRLTGDMQILGTPNYMAPEQARNPREADARCDVYSLGCTFYYLLTGRPPFAADTPIRTLLAHREAPIPSLCAEHADISPEVQSAFAKMLAKDPAQRHQSMDEVVAAFKPSALPAPSPSPERAIAIEDRQERPSAAEEAELILPLPERGRALTPSTVAAGVIVAIVLLALILLWLMPSWW